MNKTDIEFFKNKATTEIDFEKQEVVVKKRRKKIKIDEVKVIECNFRECPLAWFIARIQNETTEN